MLPVTREHNRPRREIQAHSECLRGKEYLHQRVREQDLHKFLDNGEQAAMVDSDAPRQLLLEARDLGQLSVFRLQPRDGVLYDHVDMALLLRVSEILVAQRIGILLTPLLGEDEDARR